MDLGARAAGAGLAHHPEVVLRRLVQDVGRRHRRLGRPQVGGLRVRRQAQRVVALVDGDVQAVRLQTPAVDQELPGPHDRLALEVVPEAPVAQHLEERVVVRVDAHLVEVVVLAAHAEALLRVRDAVVGPGARAQEHVLERVHPGVDEQQRRVALGHDGRRGDDLVALLAEKVQEGLAGLLGGRRGRRHRASGGVPEATPAAGRGPPPARRPGVGSGPAVGAASGPEGRPGSAGAGIGEGGTKRAIRRALARAPGSGPPPRALPSGLTHPPLCNPSTIQTAPPPVDPSPVDNVLTTIEATLGPLWPILVFVLILLVGYVVAKVVQGVVESALKKTRFRRQGPGLAQRQPPALVGADRGADRVLGRRRDRPHRGVQRRQPGRRRRAGSASSSGPSSRSSRASSGRCCWGSWRTPSPRSWPR